MKKFMFLFFLLASCSGVSVPEGFEYRELQTGHYRLASWQKITDSSQPVRIYIEGDGYSFNHLGMPTSNPTPKNRLMRNLAYNDPNPNVVYLARPCQYLEDEVCTSVDWTTGRFSKAIVDSVSAAVSQVSEGREVILIGYSGGAMISGLVISRNPDLPVKQWITIAGVLNHDKWTEYQKVRPLIDSLNIRQMPVLPQLHFVGENDSVVPPDFARSFVPNETLFVVPKATHATGYDSIRSLIY